MKSLSWAYKRMTVQQRSVYSDGMQWSSQSGRVVCCLAEMLLHCERLKQYGYEDARVLPA